MQKNKQPGTLNKCAICNSTLLSKNMARHKMSCEKKASNLNSTKKNTTSLAKEDEVRKRRLVLKITLKELKTATIPEQRANLIAMFSQKGYSFIDVSDFQKRKMFFNQLSLLL